LSAWLIWLDPLINRDAITYIRAADAYLLDGFAASQQIYSRPTLPICMAFVHQLTGLPLLHAGLAITTLFYATLCVGFVATVHTLGGNRSIQLIAAVVILSHPYINSSRSSIMRDPAYLALITLSLREMLLYARQPCLKRLLTWSSYAMLATLFRFEGFFFLALAPMGLIFTSNVQNRFRHCLQLLIPLIFVMAVLAIGLQIYQPPQASGAFPTISRYLTELLALPGEFTGWAQQSAEPMLAFTSRDDASIAVLAGLTAILALNLCRAMTWPWVIALVWGARKHLHHRFQPDDLVILRTYLLIALTYLSLFVLINRFMLERYANQAVIFGLLLVPFILNTLWHAGGWKKYLVLALLLGMTADTLHNGSRQKLFIVEATNWVAEQTDQNTSLVTNEKYIAYFGRYKQDGDIPSVHASLEKVVSTPHLWLTRDYLVMYVKPREAELWDKFLVDNQLQELRSFDGGSKGRVAIVGTRPAFRGGRNTE